MKNHWLILKVTLSVSLIVLSLAAPVNRQLRTKAGAGTTQVADGVPLPLPPKPTGIIVADGVPLPLPPRTKAQGVLVADGVPLPLPPTPPPKFVVV